MSERQDLQNKVHDFCKKIGVRYRIKENNQHQQKYRKKANEDFKGMPDSEIFIKGGKPLLFEYKLDYNRLSIDQIEWRDYLVNRGYIWHEIRDVEKAIEIILEYEGK